jgi:tRNA A-37 threonylcarbamoyl transferase component Bud32
MTTEPLVRDGLSALDAEYEIVSEIGRGGISSVYLAHERELRRAVAIKVIRDAFLEDPEARARVDREAHTLAQLQHPNIISILAARRLPDGTLALVMQLARGRTLRQAVQQDGAFPPGRALSVFKQAASALAYLHGLGIVHRDVKPDNIFVEEGDRILLADLGIAKQNDGGANVTLTGVVVGTPAYMAPEQIDGLPLDGRSDLYSLGLVIHELLTGHRPWEGENLYNIIFKQKNESLPPLGSLRPDLPAHLIYGVERALVKELDRRWSSAEELLDHLENQTFAAPPRRAGAPAAAPQQPDPPEEDAASAAAEPELAELFRRPRSRTEPEPQGTRIGSRAIVAAAVVGFVLGGALLAISSPPLADGGIGSAAAAEAAAGAPEASGDEVAQGAGGGTPAGGAQAHAPARPAGPSAGSRSQPARATGVRRSPVGDPAVASTGAEVSALEVASREVLPTLAIPQSMAPRPQPLSRHVDPPTSRLTDRPPQ